MNISLLQLRSFLAASEHLNFSEAAERLGIRQPTLSSNIKSLEAAIGGRLFDRDTHRVTLTELGRECQRHARRLLGDFDRTKDDLRKRVAGVSGSIRLAALPYAYPSLLARPLARFRELRPEVSFRFEDVSTVEAIEMLRADQVDLIIVNDVDEVPDLRIQFLTERRISALLPEGHALAASDRIGWAELRGQEVVIVNSRTLDESPVIKPLHQLDLLPTITHRVNQLSTAVGLVEAGFGIALLSQHTARYSLRPGLVARPMVEPELVSKLSMMTNAGRTLAPQVQLLQSVLASHFREVHAQQSLDAG